MYFFRIMFIFLLFFPSLSSPITFDSLLNDLIQRGTSAYFQFEELSISLKNRVL